MRWAPALVVKFSSLQVSPDSQYSTGGGVSRSGGKKMLNVMAQFNYKHGEQITDKYFPKKYSETGVFNDDILQFMPGADAGWPFGRGGL